MNCIYPIGYSTYGAREHIEELLKNPSMLLIDTRLKPWSWRVEWRQEELRTKYKERYRWAGRSLGNLNYQSGPIKLASPVEGIEKLVGYLLLGHDMILLCQCTSFDDCHVKEICRLLVEKMPEVEVVKFSQVGQSQTNTIPCLSIRQPWAWLIANGLKGIENRDWETNYRGPLLLHAGKEVDEDCFIGDEIYLDFFEQFGGEVVDALPRYKQDYPLGSIVGQTDLIDVVEESDSQWFRGTYGFVLKNARAIDPIPYRGALKLFDVPRSILEQHRQSPESRESMEPERITICQRTGPEKGCSMTWAVGDKVWAKINGQDIPAIVRQEVRTSFPQIVKIRTAVFSPLADKRIVSNDPRDFDSSRLKPRLTYVKEFGEKE